VSTSTAGSIQFRHVPTSTTLEVPESFTTPGGNELSAVTTPGRATLTNASGDTIVVTGPTTIDVTVSAVLGAIGDAVVSALKDLGGILSCTPTTITEVNLGSDGKVTSVHTTTTCGAL
jgi:hypothetical protein